MSKVDIARKQIHQLLAEDEMRYIHTLGIVLNVRQGSELHHQIMEKNTRTSTFIRRLKDEGHLDNNDDPDDILLNSRSNSRVKATKLKQNKKDEKKEEVVDPLRLNKKDDTNKELFI